MSYPIDAPQGAGAGWNGPQEQGCLPDAQQPQEAQALQFLQSLLLALNPQRHPVDSENTVTHMFSIKGQHHASQHSSLQIKSPQTHWQY